MNRLKVNICGKEYFLQTEEDPTYVYNLARALEKKINSLTENHNVSSYSASIMVAMSLLDDLKHLDREYSKAQHFMSEFSKAKEQRDSAVQEVQELKLKIAQLEDSQKFKDSGGVIPEYHNNKKSK
jgi:cell division protein ZapA